MASIKISYDREIRRVPLREDGSAFTLTKLMNTLYNLFPALTGKNFSLTWEDEEGDEVICSSDAELDDAIHVMRAMGKVLRFTVKLNENPSTAEAPKPPAVERINFVHANVTCDECGVKPIVGIRYKCAIRNDFDLCEACEAKRMQPYPMIKIVDPSQAPQVLVYGLPDGTRNDEGAWQRGWRHPHHPPHHPPHGHPHGPPPFGPPPFGPHPGRGGPFPPGPGPFGGRGHPFAEGFGHCRRRCDRWARKFAENVAKEAAPFVAAMDQVFGAEAVPSAEATPAAAPANTEDAQLEEQLIEKAILESLVINESQKAATETPATTEVPAPAAVAPSNYVETSKPANPTLPKPALRFVKDVTFPDGTIVQPGAKFRKAWKVRNDGNHPWPQGAALVSVGGDVMGNPSLKEALPSLAPEKEAEIAVQLTAPQAPGMYTGYYRAQTKEQQYFGQRLWASIVVADQEPDWQVVTENSPPATSPAPSVPAVPVVAPTPAPVVEEVKISAEPILPVSDPVPAPTAPTPVENPVLGTSTAAPVAPVEVPTPAGPPAHLRSAILLWRRELDVLSEMGFSDPELVLPLLTQHLQSPVSLSGDKNARPNAEGMQQVIATLLSLSN